MPRKRYVAPKLSQLAINTVQDANNKAPHIKKLAKRAWMFRPRDPGYSLGRSMAMSLLSDINHRLAALIDQGKFTKANAKRALSGKMFQPDVTWLIDNPEWLSDYTNALIDEILRLLKKEESVDMGIHHLMEDMRMRAGLAEAMGSIDHPMASELLAWIDYDPQLKRSKRSDYHRNLVVKIAQGKYDKEKAIKLFMYLADRAAKSYSAEHRMGPGAVNKATRMEVAKELRDEFEETWKKNRKQFAEFIPKKYKGKRMGLRVRG